jgi:hypothetical protein
MNELKREKMLMVPKQRYGNYRFLAILFGLYYVIHHTIDAVKDGNWADWTIVGVFALIMLSVFRDAYDDRRRRKAAGDSALIGQAIPKSDT